MNPNFAAEMGSAPASGAVFRALAENPRALKYFKRLCHFHAQKAEREGASSAARGGRAPQLWELS
jgi:hypothetical protein